MKLMAAMLISLVFLFYEQLGFGAEGKPFLKKIDVSVQTKEAFLNKLDNYGEFFQAPESDMLKLVSLSLRIEIKDLQALKKFIAENKDVEVDVCDWNNERVKVKLSFVKISGAVFSYGALSRNCYNGEYVLKYRGKVFISLACGNPVQDERVIAKVSEKPEEIKPPALKSLPKKNATVVWPCPQRSTIMTQTYGWGNTSGIWGASGAGILGETKQSMQVEQTVKTCN